MKRRRFIKSLLTVVAALHVPWVSNKAVMVLQSPDYKFTTRSYTGTWKSIEDSGDEKT